MGELTGKHYWPSDEFSVPADDLCWHVPPSPNADYRCVRTAGHRGRHSHEMTPTVRDYSWKDTRP